jgi:DNA ligase-1
MPDLQDGESVEVQGSASRPYVLKNVGGVFSCSCPAWRFQSLPIERRTCRHLRSYRGDAAEAARVGTLGPETTRPSKQPIQAPALLLAETWNADLNPVGYWMSEKLDGVRAFWKA